MNIQENELFDDEELEELRLLDSINVCGLYMGDFYEEETTITNWKVEKLINEYKELKAFYLSHHEKKTKE